MRVNSFSTVAMHMSFDHSESMVSLITAGSSLSDLKSASSLDRTGMTKTRPGEDGGLAGGDATELA